MAVLLGKVVPGFQGFYHHMQYLIHVILFCQGWLDTVQWSAFDTSSLFLPGKQLL